MAKREYKLRRIRIDAAALLIAPLCLGALLLYFQWRFGNALAVRDAQTAWGGGWGSLSWPWQPYAALFDRALAPKDIVDLVFALGLLALAVLAVKAGAELRLVCIDQLLVRHCMGDARERPAVCARRLSDLHCARALRPGPRLPSRLRGGGNRLCDLVHGAVFALAMGRVMLCLGGARSTRILPHRQSLATIVCCAVSYSVAGVAASKPDPNNIRVNFDQILASLPEPDRKVWRSAGRRRTRHLPGPMVNRPTCGLYCRREYSRRNPDATDGVFESTATRSSDGSRVGERDQDHPVENCRDIGSALRHPNANNAARRIGRQARVSDSSSPKRSAFRRFANLGVRVFGDGNHKSCADDRMWP